MNKNRFEELTKELLETCKEELDNYISNECQITRWEDLDEVDVDTIEELQNIVGAVKTVELKIEDGDIEDVLEDILTVFEWTEEKPFDDEDEKLEYAAILIGKKELED